MMLTKALSSFFRCSHMIVGETRACDAVCRECGKNLGFIEGWRQTTGKIPGAIEIPDMD